ncbi:hypothetical protein F4821DRAFT_146773 [Hypoxylon rubiginosum]|uniref:Uncharacterized protein n=1 Tax=Hypoxylon rubiginosum TaxID=110542 RepID=A0ACC0CZ96_9PEZI|nr:hypothetical protein F4821DRAFT_146773 [Hypoxylon rubiginosum]
MAEKQMDQSQSRRRRRDGSSGVQQRLCTHCGRSFKRSEHLERHVRTHTKEKPYICHCGSAYSRRDLLTRHQRITHETQTLSPRSPDAPSSEDNHQLATDSDPPSEDPAVPVTTSIPDMSMSHSVQPHAYSDPVNDFGLHNHAVGQPYPQLITGHDFYEEGQHYSGFEHFPEFHNFPDGAALPPAWSRFYHDPNAAEQDLVDPALRSSMIDVSSPIANENFSPHAYGHWMSPATQKWSN